MDEKISVFNYLTHVLVIFGFTMFMLNVFCIVFGNPAKDFSAMFELGNKGIPVNVAFQFLCISALIAGVRFIFFTDIFIKEMPVWLRTVCMLSATIIIIAGFIIIFHWFPVNMWQPWAMFFICFGISFILSYFIMVIKEKSENKQMEEALKRLKEKGEK